MEILREIVGVIFLIFNSMSFYLLLGFLFAGILHVLVPQQIFSKYLSKNNWISVFYATLFGIPLPLCSCGVIPTAMALYKEGASKGSVIAFLIATPQTGIDSIIATYSLLGLPFAIIRPIAAFFTSIFAGLVTNLFSSKDSQTVVSSIKVNKEKKNLSFVQKIKKVFRYGYVEMMEDIGKMLLFGLIIAGLIAYFVPDNFFTIFKGNTILTMLLILVVAIPMYVCATGSIPIAVALMAKGLTPGAAHVLLMAGPACNFASILVINKVLGKKTLICYLIAIILGSIAFGIGIDYLLPRQWFTSYLVGGSECCHEEAGWFKWSCTALLFILLLNVVRMKMTGHGHHHHHDHCDCCDSCADDTYEFVVKGMNCNHCKMNVEKAVGSIPGVEHVKVDLRSGHMSVSGTDIEKEKVRAAVESIGFSLDAK